MSDLVIVGAGGFGREVLDVVQAANDDGAGWTVVGFVDDSPSPEDAQLVADRGHEILGTTDELGLRGPLSYLIGIGTGRVRRTIDARLSAQGHRPATVVHPAATIGAQCTLEPGTIICAGARLTTNIALGRHVHVNLNSTIGHDCTLDDYVTVNPLVAVSGWVTVGTEVILGTHSSVLQGLTIGSRATIGAAACVVGHVDPDSVMVGVPARPRPGRAS